MNDTVLVDKIVKNYQEKPALCGISFDVKKGEIFGFLGPNGAGKTTTIKILTAQLRPDSGSAYVLNYDVTKHPEKIKEKIGVVFEDQNFYSRLTVLQNLIFFASLYGKNSGDVDRALEFVNLTAHKKDEAGKLSKGLRQRLLIARALLPDPEIIFLDEPTVGLDPHVARDIRIIFKNLRDQGKTIFLTTHYMEEADELCDRVAIINLGKIVALNTPEKLKETLGPPEFVINVKNIDGFIEKKVLPADSKETALFLSRMIKEKSSFKIEMKKKTLEDVFIKLTGAKLD